MRLRYKILSGFILILAMLIVAGSFSIIEFSKIGKSVEDLLEDNYRSIEASKMMLEALEREDSGVLLLLHGKWKEGREIVNYGDSLFNKSFRIVKNNITETNEENYIEDIARKYRKYKQIWVRPIVGTYKEENLDWYYNESHEIFMNVKTSVQKLMDLNQESMYEEASNLREKAKRAIMPGIIAILSAFIFMFLFNFFISYYFITPLENLTEELENFYAGKQGLKTKIESKDELGRLKDAINQVIQKIKRDR